jgi:hypothetical protein
VILLELFGRRHTDTLDTLCEFILVQSRKLLEWVPAITDCCRLTRAFEPTRS